MIRKPPGIRPSLAFDAGTLVLTRAAKGVVNNDGVWVWDERVAAWRCDAIHYHCVSDELSQRLGEAFRDELPPPARIFWPKVSLPVLRPEQTHALEAWTQKGHRGQVIMPTGTGKTEVALAAMAQTSLSTLVVAPVRDLMYQWHRRILKALGYDSGILGDRTHNLRPVTVTTYDSAAIHMPQIGGRFGLLIFDEEHHLPSPSYREAAIKSAATMRLGLTATAHRYDGAEADLDWLVGPVAYEMLFQQARGKALADYEVFRVPVHLSGDEQQSYDQYARQVRHFITERRKTQHSYTWQDLCKESGRDAAARLALKAYYLKQAIEDRSSEKLRVLEDIFRLHPGQKTIVFAGSNMMAMEVSVRFLLPTILSHTRKKERLAVLDGFAKGDFPAIVANRVLDEGVDVPEAKVAVVIGGQASTRQAKQRLGRILRKTGAVRATLYEVVCETTGEMERSRLRRRSDAYVSTRHHRI